AVDVQEHRGERLEPARDLEPAGVDGASLHEALGEISDDRFRVLAVAAEEYVLVERLVHAGERLGTDGVEARDHARTGRGVGAQLGERQLPWLGSRVPIPE